MSTFEEYKRAKEEYDAAQAAAAELYKIFDKVTGRLRAAQTKPIIDSFSGWPASVVFDDADRITAEEARKALDDRNRAAIKLQRAWEELPPGDQQLARPPVWS